jgi:hypothetical protein
MCNVCVQYARKTCPCRMEDVPRGDNTERLPGFIALLPFEKLNSSTIAIRVNSRYREKTTPIVSKKKGRE